MSWDEKPDKDSTITVKNKEKAGYNMSFPKGALDGIVVLDLTRVLCGPYGTMWLGDMGADIIKIENPKGGDDTRSWGPLVGEESAYFAHINRNKRSITLNLKTDEGKELFLKLVDHADVVVENYRPGVMDRLGLGYEALAKRNPRIIYACASGFGTYGPYADRPGYDIIAQAAGGIMSLTGQEGGPPTRAGTSVADLTCGMNLVIGILASIVAREQTGRGQRLEVSLVDSVVAFTTPENMRYRVTGQIPPRVGNRYANLCPYGAFAAKDKDFILACGNQKLFEIFCNKILNRPEVLEDPRMKDVVARSMNYPAVKELVESWSKTVTAAEAIAAVQAVGVPAGPINDLNDVRYDPHIAGAREMFPTIHQPGIGEFEVTAMPIKFDDTKTTIRMPAPALGQHNAEVYCQLLGLSEEELANYKNQNVI